jgi:hypothetical protein
MRKKCSSPNVSFAATGQGVSPHNKKLCKRHAMDGMRESIYNLLFLHGILTFPGGYLSLGNGVVGFPSNIE